MFENCCLMVINWFVIRKSLSVLVDMDIQIIDMGSEKFGLWLLSIECFYNGDYLVSLIFRILYMIRFDRSFYFDV